MAVLNFTGRKSIDRKLVEITCDHDSKPLTTYLQTSPQLRDNPKFTDCLIVVEAYLRTKAERVELGKITDLQPKVEVRFKDFYYVEGILYRLKIVNPSDQKLVGIADALREKTKKDEPEDRDRRSILPVAWAEDSDNLRDRFWKLDCDSGRSPILLLNRNGKFSALGDVNKPEFQAFAFPSILQEALIEAFIVRFDNTPTWAEDWLMLAKILGAEERPHLSDMEQNRQTIQEFFEDTRKWIDSVAALFSVKCRLGKISSDFKR